MSTKDETEALNGINAFVSGTVLFVVAIVTNGAAAMLMWRWFVVPLNAPAIGLAHAIGLMSLMRFVHPGGKTADEPMVQLMLKSLAFTAVCLLAGYVTSLFM